MAFDNESSDDLAARLTAELGGTLDDAGVQGGAEVAEQGQKGQVAQEAAGGAEAAAGAPVRDSSGRFSSKGQLPTQAQASTSGSQEAAGATAAGAAQDRIPAALSPGIKAAWSTLSPEVRAEFQRRESDNEKGRGALQGKAEFANKIEGLFASRMDRLNMAGVTREQAIERLLAAQDILERNPRAGIIALAQQYGVQLPQQGQGPGPQQAQARPQFDPGLQALMRDVAELKQYRMQQSQAQESAKSQHISQAIEQFAADPKNVYFENVRGDMAALLTAGQAKSMADAYEKAIWASPEIRPLLIKAQQAEDRAQAGAKVRQARLAGSSVAGAPGPGASPGQSAKSTNSLDDDLRAAFAAQGSRV